MIDTVILRRSDQYSRVVGINAQHNWELLRVDIAVDIQFTADNVDALAGSPYQYSSNNRSLSE